MKIYNLPFIYLTFSVFLCLLMPFLVQRGMFLDGVTYATMSRNFAERISTTQKPMYTDLYPFYEQPVLGFLIQSVFYKILGNSIYVEKIFSMLMAVLSLIGLVLCWKIFTKKTSILFSFWMPALIWITIPLVSWTFSNNMLESIITVSSIFSVYFSIKSFQKQRFLHAILSAIFIIFGFLVKGPVGIFPLVTPIIFGFIFNRRKEGFYNFILIFISCFSILLLILYIFPALKINLIKYFEVHLLPAIKDEREISTKYRGFIMWKALIQLCIPSILVLVFIFINRYKGIRNEVPFFKEVLFFVLIALSASLPLMITHKQRKYYLMPSIIYYSLAFGFILAPWVNYYIKKINLKYRKAIIYGSFFLVFITISICCIRYDKYSRDKELIEDVLYISDKLPPHTIISFEDCSNYLLNAYMYRLGYLNLDCSENKHTYYLTVKENSLPDHLKNLYVKEKELNIYTLYRRIK